MDDTKARAVAEHLRDRPIYLVSCGSDSPQAMDDLLGAVVVDRYFRDEPLTWVHRTASLR